MGNSGYDGPVLVSVAVWGKDYVSFFIDFCLPSLLAPGNLPWLRDRRGSRLILHTRVGDLDTLRDSTEFAELQSTIATDVRIIGESARAPHDVQHACHREAMHEADKYSAPMVFIAPDAIWSEGTFRRLDELLRADKRVVFLPNVRAVKEDALPTLQRMKNETGNSSWLTPRALTRIAIDHLHPTSEEYFFEPGRGVKQLPNCLIWNTAAGDLLVRSFHLHPLLVFPRRRFAHFHETIDDDLVRYACPDPNDHYVVINSDEMTCVEFSRRSQFISGICEKGDAAAVAEWAVNAADSGQWVLFRHTARLHAHPVVPEDWQTIEARAFDISQQIFQIRHRQRFVIWIKWTTIAGISAVTGLSRSKIRERLFRLRWNVRYSTGELRWKVYRLAYVSFVKFYVSYAKFRDWLSARYGVSIPRGVISGWLIRWHAGR